MDNRRTYDYLCRSRAMLFDAVRTLTPEEYRAEHPIGLDSVARTLHHMRAAEYLYTRRMAGLTSPPATLEHRHDPEPTTATALGFEELEPQWIEQADEVRTAIAGVGDWSLVRTYETSWEGRAYTYTASPDDFFAQLAFHEAHHRAGAAHAAPLGQGARRARLQRADVGWLHAELSSRITGSGGSSGSRDSWGSPGPSAG